MDTAREPRIIKADRRSRTVLAVCVVIVFLVGAVAMSLTPRVQSYLQGRDPHVALRVLQGFTAAVFLSFLPLSGYLFWVGRRAVRSRQMPPPGTWVIRDTRVIEGGRAVRRGQGLMVLAVVLAAIVLFAGLWLPYQFGKAFASRLPHSVGQTDQADSNQPDATPAP